MCARRRSPFFCWGLDAPTPARTVGLPPRWGQYFLSKRKKVPKKARGTATPGKRLLLPILTAGLATSRASKRASYLQRSCALLCSPFSAVKMGGPFSLRCLSPLCSPAAGAGQTQMAVLGMLRCSLDIFAMQKTSGISYPRWLFYASRRACRPTAVFSIQLAGNRTEPASHEACCRAAVTPQPSRMSPYAHARLWRAVWGQGVLPLVRAGGPVARRRSFLFNYQESTPDRRAVAPVVPRR